MTSQIPLNFGSDSRDSYTGKDWDLNYWTDQDSCRYIYGGLLVVNTTVKTLHNINMKCVKRVKHLHQSRSCAVNEYCCSRKVSEKGNMINQFVCGDKLRSPKHFLSTIYTITNTHTAHQMIGLVEIWVPSETRAGIWISPNINLKRVMQNISDGTCVGEAGKAANLEQVARRNKECREKRVTCHFAFHSAGKL